MVRSSGSRWVDVAWVLAFGVASSAWCLTAAQHLGPTFDEPHHLNAGLTAWRTGSNKLLMSAGCMPLPVDVQTLPLYLWELARGEQLHQYKEIEVILPAARAANLVFWWALLVYALLLGRCLGGPWAGRLAVAFLACDPNFLGHAALATTDISVVAAMLALVYHFHLGQGRGFAARVFVPGLCYGVATLAKASGMVFGVQAMLAVGLWHLHQEGALTPPAGSGLGSRVAHLWRATFQLRKDLAWIGLIGFTLVFGYTGCDWGVEPTFVTWAEGLPDGAIREVMVPVSHRLTIFPNAGEALVQQVKHNMRGHGTFLLGEWYDRATWKYFPVALTIKTPVPMLALLLIVLVVRPRDLNTPLGWVALVLLAFSLNCRVQIGIRFMFTLMAVAYTAVAVAVARGWAEPGPRGRVIPGWFVAGLVATMAGVAVWVWPHGLGYVNQLWGGPETGYLRLGDSNYDWGQGLPELAEWNRHHGEGRLAVWYYGTDPAILYPPFTWVQLQALPAGSEAEIRAMVKERGGGRYLAVSVSAVYGIAGFTDGHRAVVLWLRGRKPAARTTHFFIYDLSDSP